MTVIDLRDTDNDIWMNVVRAQRVKGAKLSKIEMDRLRNGQRWNGASDYWDDAPRPEDQDPVPG